MKKFNVLYKGRKIHTNLSHDVCLEILEEFSQRFFEGEDIDPNEIVLEEIGV
jgi:hypothetical protein